MGPWEAKWYMRRCIQIFGIASAIITLAFMLLGFAMRAPRLRVGGNIVNGYSARDSDLEKLGDDKGITDVGIHSSDITDRGVERIAALVNVRTLSLNADKLSDQALSSIAKMKNLESL